MIEFIQASTNEQRSFNEKILLGHYVGVNFKYGKQSK